MANVKEAVFQIELPPKLDYGQIAFLIAQLIWAWHGVWHGIWAWYLVWTSKYCEFCVANWMIFGLNTCPTSQDSHKDCRLFTEQTNISATLLTPSKPIWNASFKIIGIVHQIKSVEFTFKFFLFPCNLIFLVFLIVDKSLLEGPLVLALTIAAAPAEIIQIFLFSLHGRCVSFLLNKNNLLKEEIQIHARYEFIQLGIWK